MGRGQLKSPARAPITVITKTIVDVSDSDKPINIQNSNEIKERETCEKDYEA